MKSIVFSTIYFVIFLLVGLFGTGFVLADVNSSMTIEVDLIDFTPVIGIQVPDNIDLGNLSKRTMKTSNYRVDINNTGNINITITPELKNPSEEILSYLFFQRRTTEDYQRIGNWSLFIPASKTSNPEDEYCYIKLDLNSYEKNIDNDIFNYNGQIIFIAMPA
ncbi:hypothetical protein J4218_04580 [Candidatus Pacearchaeota archaeon]|nr:hypothetical protein [Candidatus Pacearchaeota archaeon]